VVSLMEDTMRRWGARCAVMTGSGPTVFGLFSPEEAGLARRALEALRGPSMAVFLVKPFIF
jgi:4-diphosphocytidyl-2C-methyl-D-erythritol kinase